MAADSLIKKPLIYAIDDDLSMNQLMEARFKKFGCDIQTFTDAQKLLDQIRSKRPHLLILDLNLGEGLSGFDLIESIRGSLHQDFPIIVVSGESQSDRVAHALELGANDFVVKPPFRFQFEEKVSEYIQAPHLAEHSHPVLLSVNPDDQAAKVDFSLAVHEVNPMGFTLISQHLIKKGASFWLSGESLQKIIPSAPRIFVTVLGPATLLTQESRQYQIRVEVDPDQENVIQDLKRFLDQVRLDSG